MSKSRLRGRAGLTCVVALVCASAVACDSVLDIQDPMIRPPEGEGGEPTSGGTAGVTAGSATTPPEGGGAGEGGTTGGTGGTDPILGGAGSGGEGGDPNVTPRDCETDSFRCTGNKPERCDEFGHWVPNEAEAADECAVQCSEGRCVECLPEQKRCAVCADGDASCNTNQPQSCVDGAWKSEGPSCAGYCDAGSCVMPPSCPTIAQQQTTCGSASSRQSCCRSIVVPGGPFYRDYDAMEYPDQIYPAEVSPFYLDKFEVTVGRFRSFVAAYAHLGLQIGDGKAPHILNDSGWSELYQLPSNAASLLSDVRCLGDKASEADPIPTWSDEAIVNNELPINCVPFNVAYAFCVWDGGRLPTEAEWNFAASGGSEQRAFPWQTPLSGEPITDEYAHFGKATQGPSPVGLLSAGYSRWGHSDLAGNVGEWVLDFLGDYPSECKDCLNSSAASDRAFRGGSFASPSFALFTSARSSLTPEQLRSYAGFRCARDIKPEKD